VPGMAGGKEECSFLKKRTKKLLRIEGHPPDNSRVVMLGELFAAAAGLVLELGMALAIASIAPSHFAFVKSYWKRAGQLGHAHSAT